MKDRQPELHAGHRDRLRNQIHENGLESLNDHQVLEALLFYTNSRCDTNELAHTIINSTGNSLSEAIDTDYDALLKIKGVGEQTAFLFEFVREFSVRYLTSAYVREYSERAGNSQDLCEFFKRIFLGVKNEELHAVGLDDELHIICEKRIAVGDPSSVGVSFRRIVEFVIHNDLSRIAISHNHPKGRHNPSSADVDYTNELADMLAKINVELVDHIVVGAGGSFSMRSSHLVDAVKVWSEG